MRTKFDEQLEELHTKLIEMGMLIEEGIEKVSTSIILHDERQANMAIEIERLVDEKERTIEALCLKLLLQQQPVAHDLRVISSALKMITDMERIGDQIEDIAELSILLLESSFIEKLEFLPKMAETASKMVRGSIDAFVNNDKSHAEAIIKMDDEVDGFFIEIKKKIISLIQKGSADGEDAIDFLMVAKYYERIADHAVNIAEWVLFSITGEHKK
ncbi:MAG: phosphate signaling complex protein PhoU [Spirochaetes bacterium]|uniref:Phosphate-specific transport system accessory protein PhoU n=1 Tax=Candidatus Gallitreponema excrementavium TaxID=2840840 RepID=A0A9D9N2W1_9SPIR|nr:phosphate signaling complex protein PhoU [Candidatus Gallitreponema excrementavium]